MLNHSEVIRTQWRN